MDIKNIIEKELTDSEIAFAIEYGNECLKAGKYDEIMGKLSFNQRLYLFDRIAKLEYHILKHLEFIKHLFTNEEALKIFNSLENSISKKLIFDCLTLENKIKYCDNIFKNIYEYLTIVNEIKDENEKTNFLFKLIDKNLFKESNIYIALDYLNSQNKLLFLDEIFKNFAKNSKVISSYYFIYIIEKIDRKDVLKVIENYIKYFDFDNKSLCKISAFIDENEILPFFFKRLDIDSKYDNYNLDKIYNILDINNKIELIKGLIDRNLINDIYFSDLIKEDNTENKLTIIDLIINNVEDYSEIIYYSTIAKIIESESLEKGKEIYKKYTIDNNYFPNLGLLNSIRNPNIQMYYLDYLIYNISGEIIEKNINKIEDFLERQDIYADGKEIYPSLINLFAKKYNLNYDNLILFIGVYGYQALTYLKLDNIQKLINLPKEQLTTILMILYKDGAKLDNDTLNTICNTLLQRKFRIDKKEDYNIFSSFETILNSNSSLIDIELKDKLIYLNGKIKIMNYLNKEKITIDEFIAELKKGNKKMMDILHNMTQDYIKKSREEYISTNLKEFTEKLNIIIKIDKNVFKKEIFKSEKISEFDIRYLFQELDEKILSSSEIELINNRDILRKIFEFKKDSSKFTPEIKSYLKTYEALLNKLYEYKYENLAKNIEDVNLPHVYSANDVSSEFILNILANLNIDQVVNNVINNEDIVKELIEIIDKYKLLGWDKTFLPVEGETDIICSDLTIASLISNFYIIRKNIGNDSQSLTKYLDYANCYDESSKRYVSLLGKDNFRLISSNTGKNKSNTTKKYRLDKIPDLVRNMYNKTEITVPPIDKSYKTEDNKEIKVVMGNSTNMINLSYGERTEACLRIGGAFNDLFEFCLGDKNGFHIRFEDPVTHEFISRVSGIRNGNTIFLNELRNSVNEKYSNEEIIEVLNKLSSELIEATKNEEVPIENIVISSDYAMKEYEDKRVDTGISESEEPFYSLHFNISKQGKFVVLKTKNQDNSLCPYKFGSDITKTYQPIRDRINKTSNPEESVNNYIKIILIDGLLKNIDMGDIQISIPQNIVYSISGEDWCITVDKDNNMHKVIVENSKQKEKQNEEMQNAILEIEEYISASQKKTIKR